MSASLSSNQQPHLTMTIPIIHKPGMENSRKNTFWTEHFGNVIENDNVKLSHCRFCGEEKSQNDLLDITGDKDTLQDYFNKLEFLKIDYVDLSNKVLPKNMCENCYGAFHEAFEFFKKVKQSQKDLNVLYNAEIDMKTEEDKLCEYTGIKIEHEDYNLNECEEHDTQIPDFENEVEDHTIVNTESLKNINEKEISSENVYALAQQNFPTGSTRFQTIAQKQVSQNKFILICELTDTKKMETIKNIDSTVNIKEHFDSPNNATNNSDFVNQLVPEIQLVIEDETANTERTSILNNSKKQNTIIQSKDTTKKPDIKTVFHKFKESISWEGYKWLCHHCKEEFSNMSELRNHSKDIHNTCFGFKCAVCPERFRTFNPFVEHVREEHYESLRLYCQYCYAKFESSEECVTHTFSHWAETTICEYCGEILQNFDALERHKRVFLKVRKASISTRTPKVVCTAGSWDNYDWSCQDCWIRMPDVSHLRTHVLNVHNKCFAMRCFDCLMVFQDYVQFVSHVRKHRPHLLNHCQFCNKYFAEKQELARHVSEHCHVCHTCGHMFAGNTELLQHIEQYNVRKPKGIPPVVNTNTTCDVCQKTYLCPASFKRHVLNMHKRKRLRDFICQTCGKGFESSSSLLNHTYTHGDKTEKCRLCAKVFTSKRRLKIHAKTHLQARPFVCDVCGQSFLNKCSIRSHILFRHVPFKIKQHKCTFCHKTFNTKSHLNIHERQHTGARPYSCEVCKRAFTCWGNCNKHMITKHGVTLAKTKYTARGRLDINRETREAQPIASDDNVEKWLNEITKTRKRNLFV